MLCVEVTVDIKPWMWAVSAVAGLLLGVVMSFVI